MTDAALPIGGMKAYKQVEFHVDGNVHSQCETSEDTIAVCVGHPVYKVKMYRSGKYLKTLALPSGWRIGLVARRGGDVIITDPQSKNIGAVGLTDPQCKTIIGVVGLTDPQCKAVIGIGVVAAAALIVAVTVAVLQAQKA